MLSSACERTTLLAIEPCLNSLARRTCRSDALCPSLPRLRDGLVVGGLGRHQPQPGGARRRRSARGFDVSAFASTACLLLFQVAVRSEWQAAAQFNLTAWWVWTGGLLGAFNVLAPVLLVDRLGTALLFCGHHHRAADLLVARRSPRGARPPTPPGHPARLLGTVFLFAGVYLVRR
jgi:hypothetical protein